MVTIIILATKMADPPAYGRIETFNRDCKSIEAYLERILCREQCIPDDRKVAIFLRNILAPERILSNAHDTGNFSINRMHGAIS